MTSSWTHIRFPISFWEILMWHVRNCIVVASLHLVRYNKWQLSGQYWNWNPLRDYPSHQLVQWDVIRHAAWLWNGASDDIMTGTRFRITGPFLGETPRYRCIRNAVTSDDFFDVSLNKLYRSFERSSCLYETVILYVQKIFWFWILRMNECRLIINTLIKP